MNQPRVLQNVNRWELMQMSKELLDQDGRLKLLPAESYSKFSPDYISAWCQLNGRYSLPTTELIAWVKERIGERSAIEVGAGMGDFGLHLGIKMTDSMVQQKAEMRALYAAIGTKPTNPPLDVIKKDALEAARKYKPQVVVASWVTQAYRPGDEHRKVGSCVYGPDEGHLLNLCETYIFVGNKNVHGDKRILEVAHEEYQFPWLVSKAADQSKNMIWVWDKAKR